MKKYIAVFGLLVVVATSSLFHSCQKDKIQHDETSSQTNQSTKDAQIKEWILAFKDRIGLVRENPSLKSGSDPMEIDSAIWYIEATSNFTYGNANTDMEGYVVDSSFIEVTLTNGQILLSDVQYAYDKVIDSLSAHNASITTNEKQLIVADISLKETSTTTVTLEVTSGFGTDAAAGFINDNSWFWGWQLGTCDDTGYGAGWDAADKIAQLANYTIALPIGGNAYYTDIIDVEKFYMDEGLDTYSNPYGEYLLYHFYHEGTPYNPCLSTDEINYYKGAAITIGGMFRPTNEHSVFKYSLWDETMYGLTPDWEDTWDKTHFINIKYVIWHSDGGIHQEF